MAVTASLVKELRERTGGGYMDCKKALDAAQGDLEQAIEILRKSGQIKAAKKAGRIAAEGLIVIKTTADNTTAVMVEVNTETDFVARDQNLVMFAQQIAECALTARSTSAEQLLNLKVGNQTIADLRQELVAKLGENINVRRQILMTAPYLGCYVHGTRIGVIVGLSKADAVLAKDIAMHIAANKPQAISGDDLAPEVLAKEKEIYLAQVQTSGKPPAILEKMIVGRMQKFVSENTLLGQPFVKDLDITVAELLKRAQAQVLAFTRFEVGEGIERKTSDFAAEVQATVAQSK